MMLWEVSSLAQQEALIIGINDVKKYIDVDGGIVWEDLDENSFFLC